MKPGNLCHKEICHVTMSNLIHRIYWAAHPPRRRPISAIVRIAERGP